MPGNLSSPVGRRAALIAIALLASVSAASASTDYPARPITLVHGYGAGGSSDIGCRLLADALKEVTKQPVVVEPRPGAGGQIAWSKFKQSAKPDGYELIYVNVPQIQTIMFDPARKADFSLKDFRLIANHVQDPNILVVARNSPYRTLEEFIAAAKANPGKLSITTSGLGSDDHLAILDLQMKAGVTFTIIHTKGDAEGMNGILGGHMDAMMANVGGMVQPAEQGQTRILGVLAESRSADLPDVPTFKERGLPVFASSTRGIAVPLNTPPAVVDYIEQALRKAMTSPQHQQAMRKAGFTVKFMGGSEYQAFVDGQSTWVREMMKQYVK
ncbi:MAG TPA: tripartite tricarboxylate transporter substrate binding protein [Ramlibacter sp.]|jgi:tripartite-type tricarboxylate transporter receptor subunit TctC|nr:tripartite tricarboxylate transporter substrate binding protein [Ramlibacter sp.]